MTASALANIALGGIFHAAVLFLVAAGLQLVFGIQKILNLACGSFYALGAYFGITVTTLFAQYGMPAWMLLPALIGCGLALGVIGPLIERVLRTVYDRDESFQLLLTFALVCRARMTCSYPAKAGRPTNMSVISSWLYRLAGTTPFTAAITLTH